MDKKLFQNSLEKKYVTDILIVKLPININKFSLITDSANVKAYCQLSEQRHTISMLGQLVNKIEKY